MKIVVSPNAVALGKRAAEETAEILRAGIARDGIGRIVLSTGASQFTTLEALTAIDGIDWKHVEMFHLDEYIGLPQDHPASFRKYLQERFVDKTGIEKVHFVPSDPKCVAAVGEELRRAPVHVGLIGIGRNAHIAFNDPPADFDTDEPYLVVTLVPECRRQQVAEGWFAKEEEVPAQAITMSVRQIMRCEHVIAPVPYPEKAEAVRATLETPLDPMTPATMLKTHEHFSLYVDKDSFARVNVQRIVPAEGKDGYCLRVYTN